MANELKEIITQISSQGKTSFLEGATEKQIEQFEKNNDIRFPIEYKEWLTFSDGGECFLPAGVQFYGIAHKPMINVNDDDRPDDKFIVIGALASGDPVLCETEGEKVAIYNHEAGRIEDDEIYDNFFAFLKGLYVLLGIGE